MAVQTNNEPSGILIINKPAGMTSHDVVSRVRRLYSTKRVGHTGTLDPMATGVLVVLIGRAAKASEYALSGKKSYVATLRLGLESDTEDITGNILSQKDGFEITEEQFLSTLPSFMGEIMQVPPMYSALKRGGKKLCDLARDGVIIEREARGVTIHALEAQRLSDTDYRLYVECSSGTYIRTLCADIGKALGVGAVMTTLIRTSACGFNIENAVDLDSISNMSEDEKLSLLHHTEELFFVHEKVQLPQFYEKLFRNGCEIYLSRARLPRFEAGTVLRIYGADGEFFALGQVKAYPDGLAIHSLKLFVL